VLADERRIDDEAAAVGERAHEVNKKLYSGTVSSPRELQAMQADIDMLHRRRSDLEDEELEVMEQRETLDGELATLDAAVAVLQARVAELTATISAAEAEIDAEIARETAARADLAAPIAESLLRDYERRRAQNRGAGAARLVGTTCQACHLTIPSTEAEQVRRGAGSVVSYCDNCSAILVP
jgi:predicted  nucleic acid-binding Zn-ribbon protein